MKLLDAGSYGIVCPMINTAGECERFVGACPLCAGGATAASARRAGLLYGGPDYASAANDHHRHNGDDRDRRGGR